MNKSDFDTDFLAFIFDHTQQDRDEYIIQLFRAIELLADQLLTEVESDSRAVADVEIIETLAKLHQPTDGGAA